MATFKEIKSQKENNEKGPLKLSLFLHENICHFTMWILVKHSTINPHNPNTKLTDSIKHYKFFRISACQKEITMYEYNNYTLHPIMLNQGSITSGNKQKAMKILYFGALLFYQAG